jgi:SAM-dependent methyltransferase
MKRLFYTSNTIRYQVEWARILEAISTIGHQDVVFDGGCGSGEYLKRIQDEKLCRKIVGLEYDDGNFKKLKANLKGRANARIFQGSILNSEIPSALADLVMTTQVLEHIEDHEQAARELNRILKPGGYALVTVPHPPEPFPNDGHVREGYTKEDLLALFSGFGWELLRTDYFLTRRTIDALITAEKFPLKGRFFPLVMINKERNTTAEERREDTPFGILALFKKASQ